MELPLFPLSTVLFPGSPIPLHIFEERYRQMFARVLQGDRRFGVVAISEGREVGDSAPGHQRIGCIAEVREVRPYPDGRLDIVGRGGARFQVDSLVQAAPYIVAEVTELEEAVGESIDRRRRKTAKLFATYLSTLLAMAGEEPGEVELPDDPVAASYVVATGLHVDLAEKQHLLAQPTASERLTLEGELLRRELALLERLEAVGPAPMAGPFSLN